MATNYAKASYTEIIDLQTVKNKATIIGIHTPTGDAPYQKLRGFFSSFRKYRYKGIARLTMVPAAQLPVDPLGLTGVVGTTDLMDPRDNLNPIMFHGCHGESMDWVIDRFFGHNGTLTGTNNVFNPTSGYVSSTADCLEQDMSLSNIEARYYARLTDPTWKKFGIQSGVMLRKLHPLTWRVSQSQPLLPAYGSGTVAGVITPAGSVQTIDPGVTSGVSAATEAAITGGVPDVTDIGSEFTSIRTVPQMFTNGVSRLSWLPTTTFGYGTGSQVTTPVLVELPKLFMGMLVLPPAYNIEQFFRLSITHVFEFKEFTESLGFAARVFHPSDGPGAQQTDTYATPYFNWIQYTTTPEGKVEQKVVESDPIDEGTTLDIINGSSEVVSDGVL